MSTGSVGGGAGALVVPASSPAAATLVLDALRTGLVAAIPTDTVYGLVADPARPSAVSALVAAKGRTAAQDLQVLVAGRDQALALAGRMTPAAERLIERFWPGALTVVVERAAGLALALGGDGTSVGMRCPDHPVPLALCAAFGPVAASSANRHGEPVLMHAGDIAAVMGDAVALVVDGGPGSGRASTVVDCRTGEPRCLREGSIPWDDVRDACA